MAGPRSPEREHGRPGEPGEGAGRCAHHHQGAISANQRVLEIDPTGWGKRAAAWVCIAAIKREAILDLREQQLFVRAQGLCRALRSPLRLGDKKRPWGLQLPPPRKGGVQAVGPAASGVKSKLSGTLAGPLLYPGCTEGCCSGDQWAPFRASQVALMVKNPPINAEDIGDRNSIPGWGRPPGRGHGNPLRYSCPENPMDRGSWRATVHGVEKRTEAP